jgi:hypothetical protein
MAGELANPKKVLTMDFALDKVKVGVERISWLSSSHKFTKGNPGNNQYTFEAGEFLSLGVYIDINLLPVSERKTDLIIEVRRKVGPFEQPYEITYANYHLETIVDLIIKGIHYSDHDFSALKQKLEEKRNEGFISLHGGMANKNKIRNRIIILSVLLVIILFFIYRMLIK